MMTLSPQQQNEAEAHARLELLSNASLLKNVMDINSRLQTNLIPQTSWTTENSASPSFEEEESDEELNNSMDSNFTPPKCKGRMRRNSKETESTEGSLITKQHRPVVEKSSSSSSTSPASVVMPPSVSFPTAPSSYAALLMGKAPPTTTVGGYYPSQQLSVLAHQLPRFPSGPYSAFHAKVVAQQQVSNTNRSKENVPPTFITASPPPPQAAAGEEEREQQQKKLSSYEALLAENIRLKEQLETKDQTIETLQSKADGLEKQIGELRQLPTGKISHIPIEDMIRIMQDYGSEISNQTLPKRKQPIQKASIVRQFRRWNPEFFRYFVHVNGEWVPRLGRDGELKRRQEKRRTLQDTKKRSGCSSPDSSYSSSCNTDASVASSTNHN